MIIIKTRDIRCPCGEQILQNYPNGSVKVRSKVLVFDPERNSAYAVCRKCAREIEIPVKLVLAPSKHMSHYILEKDKPKIDEEGD